jgi:hypothetical protein
MATYPGFPNFDIPYTYTPNNFFDVLIMQVNDRSVIRIVSYMLYKQITLTGRKGKPYDREVLVTYQELVERAGVARGSIRPALDKAIELNFIECVRPGQPHLFGSVAVSPLFKVKWDYSKTYGRSVDSFNGFYPYKDQHTWIPNDFFELVVTQEPLAVIRLVGTILRHTIGWEDEFGYRQLNVQMSYTTIQNVANLSGRSLWLALNQAIEKGYILRAKNGFFDPRAGKMSESAIYTPKWRDLNIYLFNDHQPPPTNSPLPKQTESQVESNQNSKTETAGSVQKVRREIGSKSKAGSVQKVRREIGSKSKAAIIGIKNYVQEKEYIKQQQGADAPELAAADIYSQLQNEGFDHQAALNLTENYTADQITQQIEWLGKRNPSRNRLGMLRKAIEESWPKPQETSSGKDSGEEGKGSVFARYFYAGFAGNPEAPVALPSANDLNAAEGFVARLLSLWPDHSSVADWGRQFGVHYREAMRGRDGLIVSLVGALRTHGDEYFKQFKTCRLQVIEQENLRLEQAHYDEFHPPYLTHLKDLERRIREDHPKPYAEFETRREEERKRIEQDRRVVMREETLARFDSEEKRLQDLRAYFTNTDLWETPWDIPDFWQWDELANPQRLATDGTTP